MRYSNNSYERDVYFDASKKRRYYNALCSPTIPNQIESVYVITVAGDRLDLLAWDYYNDTSLWFIIAAANPDLRKDSLFIDPGTQLRIPVDYQQVLKLFNEQNNIN